MRDDLWGFLYKNDQFQKATQEICTDKFPHWEPIQVNLLPMVPGQALGLHYDIGWFSSKSLFNLSIMS